MVGQEVPLALWQRVSGADDEALAGAVGKRLEADLLMEASGGAVRFSHALVREALYQGIVLVRRRAWHRKVGEALAERVSPDPDAVAHHFEEAGDPRAIKWLYRAASRAEQSYAMQTAVTRLDAVLRLQEAHGVEIVAPQTLLFQMSTFLRYTDTRAALGHLDAALALAERAGDRTFAAVGLGQRGYLRWFLGEMRAGMIDLDQAALTADRLLEEDPAAFDHVDTHIFTLGPPGISYLRASVGARRDVRIAFGALLGQLAYALTLGKPLKDAVFARLEEGAIGPAADYDEIPGSGPHNIGNLLSGLGIAYSLLGRVDEAHRCFSHVTVCVRLRERCASSPS